MSRVKTWGRIRGGTDIRARFHRILTWLRRRLVEEVPLDVARCEFDCRKVQCRSSDWEACEDRKKDIAVVQGTRHRD